MKICEVKDISNNSSNGLETAIFLVLEQRRIDEDVVGNLDRLVVRQARLRRSRSLCFTGFLKFTRFLLTPSEVICTLDEREFRWKINLSSKGERERAKERMMERWYRTTSPSVPSIHEKATVRVMAVFTIFNHHFLHSSYKDNYNLSTQFISSLVYKT